MASQRKIRALVLGGGGAKGFVALGALHYHQADWDLELISGTSIGSVIGMLIGAGYTPEEIKTLAARVDPQVKFSFGQWTTTYGLTDINLVLSPAFDAMEAKLGSQVTFADYHRLTGVDLVVCAGNVTRGTTVYFRSSTHPKVLVRDAVCASCAVPFLFAAVEIGRELYVDGGGSDNFPHLPVPRELAPSTLAIRLIGLSNNPPPISGPVDFLLRLTVLMTSSPHRLPPEMTYLELRVPDIVMVPLSKLDESSVDEYFSRGYKDAWSLARKRLVRSLE